MCIHIKIYNHKQSIAAGIRLNVRTFSERVNIATAPVVEPVIVLLRLETNTVPFKDAVDDSDIVSGTSACANATTAIFSL